MVGKLQGLAALVTGASSGIGAATALALVEEGASVALVARREDKLNELAEQVRGVGGTAVTVVADITDQAAAEAAVQKAVDELGRLDVVVNNAGVMLLGPAVDAPVSEWEQMIQVNGLALMYVTKAALPHLLDAAKTADRKVADIVNLSSLGGRETIVGGTGYHFTKYGVIGFSDGLRREVGKQGVRVSVIEPGPVETELMSHVRPEVVEAIASQFADVTPLQASDIAETIAFVVTRRDGSHVSETVIRPTTSA